MPRLTTSALFALVTLLAVLASPSAAEALTCTSISNVVGVVERAVRMGQTMEVTLKDAVAYDLREIGILGRDHDLEAFSFAGGGRQFRLQAIFARLSHGNLDRRRG